MFSNCSKLKSLLSRLAFQEITLTFPGTYPLLESMRSREYELSDQEPLFLTNRTPSTGQNSGAMISAARMVHSSPFSLARLRAILRRYLPMLNSSNRFALSLYLSFCSRVRLAQSSLLHSLQTELFRQNSSGGRLFLHLRHTFKACIKQLPEIFSTRFVPVVLRVKLHT